MPRQRRNFVNELEYHITLRGNNRRIIFHEDFEKIYYLKLCHKYAVEQHVVLHAYIFMDNHIHIQCSFEEPGCISTFMKKVNHQYALFKNKRTGGSGKLFERRFAAHDIMTPQQSLNTKIYIESNLIRAGLDLNLSIKPWNSYMKRNKKLLQKSQGQKMLCDCFDTYCWHYERIFSLRMKFLLSKETREQLLTIRTTTPRIGHIPTRPDGSDAR